MPAGSKKKRNVAIRCGFYPEMTCGRDSGRGDEVKRERETALDPRGAIYEYVKEGS